MQGLFDFLKKYSYWLLFILLEGGSLLLLFRFNLYQGSVWFTSANTVSGRVLEWESDFLSYIALGERNKDLMRKNLVLEQRVRALTELLDRAEHDSTYTEMRQRELLDGFGMVSAEVVSNSVNKHNNYLTINKGEQDGVKPEMGVVCGTGIVGIVYLTSPHYAIVMPLLNSKSNISCKIIGSDYFGYLKWEHGDSRYAYLKDLPRHAEFNLGDTVVTSGFSTVFPEGIMVGTVDDMSDSNDGLSYLLKIKLATDFGKLSDVRVVARTGQEEQKKLENKVMKE